MIVREVAAESMRRYGYTAEQIASKAERDPSTKKLLPHMLEKIAPMELQRLLQEVIPNRYFSIESEYADFGEKLRASNLLETVYHAAFAQSPPILKKELSEKAIKIMVDESDPEYIRKYINAFFTVSDLEHVTDPSKHRIATAHLLSRFAAGPDERLLEISTGIGARLETEEVPELVDACFRQLPQQGFLASRTTIPDWLNREFASCEGEIKVAWVSRLRFWVKHYQSEQNLPALAKLKPLRTQWLNETTFEEDEIPF